MVQTRRRKVDGETLQETDTLSSDGLRRRQGRALAGLDECKQPKYDCSQVGSAIHLSWDEAN